MHVCMHAPFMDITAFINKPKFHLEQINWFPNREDLPSVQGFFFL